MYIKCGGLKLVFFDAEVFRENIFLSSKSCQPVKKRPKLRREFGEMKDFDDFAAPNSHQKQKNLKDTFDGKYLLYGEYPIICRVSYMLDHVGRCIVSSINSRNSMNDAFWEWKL